MDLLKILAAPSGRSIRLYHGASQQSAESLNKTGVDSAAAISAGGTGEFWATTSANDAEIYAFVNPAGPPCAVFSFEVSDYVLHDLLSVDPPEAILHVPDVLEFQSPSFAALNREMRSKDVRSVP